MIRINLLGAERAAKEKKPRGVPGPAPRAPPAPPPPPPHPPGGGAGGEGEEARGRPRPRARRAGRTAVLPPAGPLRGRCAAGVRRRLCVEDQRVEEARRAPRRPRAADEGPAGDQGAGGRVPAEEGDAREQGGGDREAPAR